jgi:hypothetical protein
VNGRIRTIKPDFFDDEDLAELAFETRLLFIALWTIADRDGRLDDRPRKIKLRSFPWDDVDIPSMLNDLSAGGFIERYEVEGKSYIEITNFAKHQRPNQREAPSSIPSRARTCTHVHARGEVEVEVEVEGEGKGKGREVEGRVASPASQLAIAARKQAQLASMSGNQTEERRQLKRAEAFERKEGLT